VTFIEPATYIGFPLSTVPPVGQSTRCSLIMTYSTFELLAGLRRNMAVGTSAGP
jgi:hypothetical protein